MPVIPAAHLFPASPRSRLLSETHFVSVSDASRLGGHAFGGSCNGNRVLGGFRGGGIHNVCGEAWSRYSINEEEKCRRGLSAKNIKTHPALRQTHSTSLNESSGNQEILGRRDLALFTMELASALIVGRWAEGGPALAISQSDRRSPFDEKRLLEQNRRMQTLNSAPLDFPGFIREGFDVKVVTSDKYVKAQSGLIYFDLVEGQGSCPQDGQQVVFHYTGYNESGRRVDSSYQQGQPARTRLGIKGMIPGFEEGIRTMRLGGKRRIVIPPELGPPVGPSTFFSAKQFEVFDVELLEVKDCKRRTIGFYSDVICE